ncbi:MAG: rhamnulokinase [bacterium]
MSVSKFLAIDLGAESGRAILGVLENNKIHLEEIHRFPNKQIYILGHLHWDVLALFEEIKTGMRIAVQKGHGDIESIGVDTWGVDFGFAGKNNELLGFPYCYRDSRTNNMMEKLFQTIPREEIYSVTGIQFWQFNSIFQLARYADDDSDMLRVADILLFMPDIINFLLTGVKKTEYTIASTSQLLNAYSKNWDLSLLEKLKLPINIMPEIVPPGTVIGKLLPEIAKEVGLKEIEVIAPGCHDTASAVAAVPIQGINSAFVSSGTWSIIGIESATPIINEASLKNNFTNEGGVGNKIRFMSNMMGMWLLQQTRKSWLKQNVNISYEEMTKLASDAKPFKCIIDTDDNSFYNPPDMQEAIREYCIKNNQPIPGSKGEYVRCILENLAIKYKTMIEKINSMSGKKIDTLHIVGGGSQNELLNQFAADACGIPVVAGPVEATALGNIIVQAIAKNKIASLDDGRRIVAESFQVKTYQPKKSRCLEEQFSIIISVL